VKTSVEGNCGALFAGHPCTRRVGSLAGRETVNRRPLIHQDRRGLGRAPVESGPLIEPTFPEINSLGYRLLPCLSAAFPSPGRSSRCQGYKVIDVNGIVLAHVHGQPDGAVAFSDTRLTQDEARRISKLISRLPELVELEKDRNKARSRRKPQLLRIKAVTIGDLIRDGRFLEVHCAIAGRSVISISTLVVSTCRSVWRCRR
jgi:hypothetical protein